MKFLTLKDLTNKIKENILADVCQASNIFIENNPILECAEEEAISIVRLYLNNLYDCNFIFSQTLNDRNSNIVNITSDITIYCLLSRTTTDLMPEIRLQRYTAAVKLLQDIRDKKMTIDSPEKNVNYELTTAIMYHSNKRTQDEDYL